MKKPNILVIWGDDVVMWNISAYHRGMMGGSTPNIDRIAVRGHDLHGSLRPGVAHGRASRFDVDIDSMMSSLYESSAR